MTSIGTALDHLRVVFAPMLGARIAVEVIQRTEDDVVVIDPAQLDQVLVNLALYARDAMPSGGTLRFEVSTTDIDDVSAIPLGISAGRYVTVTVADTGRAYGIITVGRIDLRDVPARPTPAASSERAITSPASAGTVLIVEDDPQVRAVIERVLTRAGYDVDAHEFPLSALEAISRTAPSLVLTDIVMPELDGFVRRAGAQHSMPTSRCCSCPASSTPPDWRRSAAAASRSIWSRNRSRASNCSHASRPHCDATERRHPRSASTALDRRSHVETSIARRCVEAADESRSPSRTVSWLHSGQLNDQRVPSELVDSDSLALVPFRLRR